MQVTCLICVQIAVQRRVNTFEMYGEIMTQVDLKHPRSPTSPTAPPAQVPTMIYAVLAGSLSDKFGRGPLLVLPIVGQILEGIALLANTVTRTWHITRHKPYIFRHQVWFAELPLEALWLANVYDWFGGSAVWYLGVYTFAADITAPGERASRMAR